MRSQVVRFSSALALVLLSLSAACKKASRPPSDIAALCNQVQIRLRGWDGRLDDPQLDCPRLASIGTEAVAFTKALHESVLKSQGEHSEALSLVVDLEASTTAWAGEVGRCQNLPDWNERLALIKSIADKVRSSIASERDRVQGRCGGRGAAK